MGILSDVTLSNTPYISQYVGSTLPEIKESAAALKDIYYRAQDQDSLATAAAKQMMNSVHPADREAAQALFDDTNERINQRLEAGNYERMYHNTVQDARNLAANITPLMENKARIEEGIKTLQADKDIDDSYKPDLIEQMVSTYGGKKFNKEKGIIEGSDFQSRGFAKDYNITENMDRMLSGIQADGTSYSGGEFKMVPDGEGRTRLAIIEGNGNRVFVDESRVRDIAKEYFGKGNTDFHRFVDRQTDTQMFKNKKKGIEMDREQVRQAVEGKYLNDAIDGAAKKYAFNRTDSNTNLQATAGNTKTPPDLQGPGVSYVGKTQTAEPKKSNLSEAIKGGYDVGVQAGTYAGGVLGHSSASALKPDRKIEDLVNQKDKSGNLEFPGLKDVMSQNPRKKNDSDAEYAKRLEPIYDDFRQKAVDEDIPQVNLSAKRKEDYEKTILGEPIKDGKGNIVGRAGSTANQRPIAVIVDGKVQHFDNVQQAIEADAITEDEVNQAGATGINLNMAINGSGVVFSAPTGKNFIIGNTNEKEVQYNQALQGIEQAGRNFQNYHPKTEDGKNISLEKTASTISSMSPESKASYLQNITRYSNYKLKLGKEGGYLPVLVESINKPQWRNGKLVGNQKMVRILNPLDGKVTETTYANFKKKHMENSEFLNQSETPGYSSNSEYKNNVD